MVCIADRTILCVCVRVCVCVVCVFVCVCVCVCVCVYCPDSALSCVPVWPSGGGQPMQTAAATVHDSTGHHSSRSGRTVSVQDVLIRGVQFRRPND